MFSVSRLAGRNGSAGNRCANRSGTCADRGQGSPRRNPASECSMPHCWATAVATHGLRCPEKTSLAGVGSDLGARRLPVGAGLGVILVALPSRVPSSVRRFEVRMVATLFVLILVTLLMLAIFAG